MESFQWAGTLCAILVTLAVLLCAFTEITRTAASAKTAFYSTPEGPREL